MTVLYLRDLLQQSKLFVRPNLEDIQILDSSSTEDKGGTDDLYPSSDSEKDVITVDDTECEEESTLSTCTKPSTADSYHVSSSRPFEVFLEEEKKAFMVADSDDEWEEMIQQAVDKSLADGTAPIP